MADDEKGNNNQEQKPNKQDGKYSLTVSIIKEKLQLHLHDKETKYMHHGSFNTEDLQKCGFPVQYAQKVDIVAKILESARKGHKQWTLTLAVESDFANVTVMKDDDFVPLKIVMKLKKTQRKEMDIVKEHIKDLKDENKRLRDELAQLNKHCVPKGSIMIWSGNASDVPKGWKLCDGNHNTPDLRNRFVMGASDTVNVHSRGGSKCHKHDITVKRHRLTIAEMPSHTHRSEHAIFTNHKGSDNSSVGKSGGGFKHWSHREHEKLNKVGVALWFLQRDEEVSSKRESEILQTSVGYEEEHEDIQNEEEELQKKLLNEGMPKRVVEEFEAKTESESDRMSSKSISSRSLSLLALSDKAISGNRDEVKLHTDILMTKQLEKVKKCVEGNKYEQKERASLLQLGIQKEVIEEAEKSDNKTEKEKKERSSLLKLGIQKEEIEERVNDLAVESIVHVN